MKIKIKYTCGNYVWIGEPPYIEEPPICDSEGEFFLDVDEKEWNNEQCVMVCPECGHAIYYLDGGLKITNEE